MSEVIREYSATACSTDTCGRVLCSAREQHFVIDGPVWNGCPGEALTPGEAFLAAVAACGVELLQAIAAGEEIQVDGVQVAIEGVIDRDSPLRDDVTVFNRVRMRYEIAGPTAEQAQGLVDAVGRRCPLFGSIAASAGELAVEVYAS
jgi:uncharacterized OsmC-like protein